MRLPDLVCVKCGAILYVQAQSWRPLPETGFSGTHLEPGCREWNTVRTSWQFGTCPPGRENSWRKAHRKSALWTDGPGMAGAQQLAEQLRIKQLRWTSTHSKLEEDPVFALMRWSCSSRSGSVQHPSSFPLCLFFSPPAQHSACLDSSSVAPLGDATPMLVNLWVPPHLRHWLSARCTHELAPDTCARRSPPSCNSSDTGWYSGSVWLQEWRYKEGINAALGLLSC